jgi:5-methylthioadenosine/S-adenosylhomocysteine deaminase
MTDSGSGLLILPGFLIDSPGEPPKRNWGVRVLGSEIAEVAPNEELRQAHPEDAVRDAPGQVLSPGFVNAHTHLYGVLAHGIPLAKAPSGFWPFLEDFWWPLVEDRLDHAMIRASTDLQCARMLASGVTSFYDVLEAPGALPGCLDVQADVVRKHGLRGRLSFEATQRMSDENGQLGLSENARFIRGCRDGDDRLGGLMCFHTTFTCSADFIRRAFELGESLGVLTHMHCSEGTYEPEHTLTEYGMRPMAYYDQLGVASSSMLASQCVQVDDSEIALMAERGVRMTHMPLSNCEVGGGIAPVPELLAAGVTVGLGSDGYIDDFFEVMRGAFLIHKANHQDPRVMPADVVWRLATEGGAKAIGLDRVGRLEPGWRADLVLIDGDLPTPLSQHNLYEQLVLYRNQTDVDWVMVDGEVRLENGALKGADMEGLTAAVHEQARRLWSAAE